MRGLTWRASCDPEGTMAAHEISPREVVSDRTPRALAGTCLSFDIAREVELLEQEQPWTANGHNARTLLKNEDMRLVLIVLKRGARIREHQTYRQIVLQAVRGHVRIHLPDAAPE